MSDIDIMDMAVRAPYNFVPFPGGALWRYSSKNDLPPHDRIDPSLKTGEIRYTMVAETPVFVSDGNKQDPHFFRDLNGRYAIPGSSVRGMLRANMQILGLGVMRKDEDMEDMFIMYREFAAAKNSVAGELKGYYQAILDIQSRMSLGNPPKPYSVPLNVRGGYLKCEKGAYMIEPIAGECIRVPIAHEALRTAGELFAQTLEVSYRAENGYLRELQLRSNVPGLQNGILLCTGKPVHKNNHHHYLFPEADPTAESETVSDQDILSYKVDLEARRNSLKHDYSDRQSFWALPEEGKKKPVFYVRHNGHLYFGMTRFPRVGHEYSVSEGLKPLSREQGATLEKIDYPHAIFGYAVGQSAYRSRVSFGNCDAVGTPKEMPAQSVILSSPKQSYYPGYVKGGKHYSAAGFELRGYKRYWLKPPTPETVAMKSDVTTQIRALPEKTSFTGCIRFKNLHDDELGLLLWCLRLNEDCYQSVGMGKPYGFGRMKVRIDDLRLYDPESLYGSFALDAAPRMADTGKVDDLIAYYDQNARSCCGSNAKKKPCISKDSTVQDFFFICSAIRKSEDVRYMTLDEYGKCRIPLPELKSEREKNMEGQNAEGGKIGLTMQEQLLNKWGSISNRGRKDK